MLSDRIPRCPFSHYVIRLRGRIVHVVEVMAEAGAVKGQDLRGSSNPRYWDSRYRHGDVVQLNFPTPHKHVVVGVTVTTSRTISDVPAPHKHIVVGVTVTSARTISDVPTVRAPLPLPANLALGAQQAKLHADIRSSSSVDTPSIESRHDFTP
jgi:hypothetical protein